MKIKVNTNRRIRTKKYAYVTTLSSVFSPSLKFLVLYSKEQFLLKFNVLCNYSSVCYIVSDPGLHKEILL